MYMYVLLWIPSYLSPTWYLPVLWTLQMEALPHQCFYRLINKKMSKFKTLMQTQNIILHSNGRRLKYYSDYQNIPLLVKELKAVTSKYHIRIFVPILSYPTVPAFNKNWKKLQKCTLFCQVATIQGPVLTPCTSTPPPPTLLVTRNVSTTGGHRSHRYHIEMYPIKQTPFLSSNIITLTLYATPPYS